MYSLDKLRYNLRYSNRKEISQKATDRIMRLLLGRRNNFVIWNINIKKALLTHQLASIRSLAASKHRFAILSEFTVGGPKNESLQRFGKEWAPGFLLRFFSKPYLEHRREFPSVMINIGSDERSIAVLEARKLNMPTFAYADYNVQTFQESDFGYPMSVSFKKHFKVIYRILIANIIYRTALKSRFVDAKIRGSLKLITHFRRYRNIDVSERIISYLKIRSRKFRPEFSLIYSKFRRANKRNLFKRYKRRMQPKAYKLVTLMHWSKLALKNRRYIGIKQKYADTTHVTQRKLSFSNRRLSKRHTKENNVHYRTRTDTLRKRTRF